jgi:RNA polymerase sigma-70 factor (ECF subfamily)
LQADCIGDHRYDRNIVIETEGSLRETDADDCALMASIAARRQDALRMLYARHASRLFALCLRIVNDRSEAEQILIDVFWEIWQRADRYDAARAAPLTYLTILTRSRALDKRRRQKSAAANESAHGSTLKYSLDASVASPAAAPLSHLLANEQSRSVREALLSLDDDERSLIEACFFDGYTHVQLAAKLKQPLGTVKTRIRRGLARLRIKLRHVFDEPRPPSDTALVSESEAQ